MRRLVTIHNCCRTTYPPLGTQLLLIKFICYLNMVKKVQWQTDLLPLDLPPCSNLKPIIVDMGWSQLFHC